jgi:hypothetical protein
LRHIWRSRAKRFAMQLQRQTLQRMDVKSTTMMEEPVASPYPTGEKSWQFSSRLLCLKTLD